MTNNQSNKPSRNEIIAHRKRETQSWILSLPAMLWLTIFFLIPYLIILLYSFLQTNVYDIEPVFSLEAYTEIFSYKYIHPFWTSLKFAFYTTVLCLLLGYPASYFIARSSEKLRNIFLILVIIPFWTNFVIRIFSWRIFLAPHGALSNLLLYSGVIDTPLRLLRTDFAVLLVMVYVYLPYMILPLYSVIEKLDFSLLDAAMDLGAKPFKAFLKVTLPLTKQGILAGTMLVFIPALGTYIIPQLIGHKDSLFIGQVITYKVKNIPRNWPVASALSFVLMLIVCAILIVFYYINLQINRREKERSEGGEQRELNMFSTVPVTEHLLSKHERQRKIYQNESQKSDKG
ncbi:MAG: ABC transporter permease [Candidatus Cloacimonetes bacterium]|nr:ABC transporter permease [Candidatus Cloacimonadota bacterium]